MYKKSYYFFSFIFLTSITLFTLTIYLYQTKALSKSSIKMKNIFVKTTSLPDLAISTEATFIRHRSLSSIFSIYKDDGVLREYYPSSYVYKHITPLDKIPSKIVNVK